MIFLFSLFCQIITRTSPNHHTNITKTAASEKLKIMKTTRKTWNVINPKTSSKHRYNIAKSPPEHHKFITNISPKPRQDRFMLWFGKIVENWKPCKPWKIWNVENPKTTSNHSYNSKIITRTTPTHHQTITKT